MAKRNKKGSKPASSAEPADAIPRKDMSQLDSASFRVFSGIIAIIFLLNLLLQNGLTSVWSGAEAYNLWSAMGEERLPNLLAGWLRWVYDDGPLSLFMLRIGGPVALLIAILAGWWLGRRLYGKITIWLALLLLAASLLLPNMAKRAVVDNWLFASQFVFGLSTLVLLKQDNIAAKAAWIGALVLSVLLEPLGSLLFAVPLILFLWRSHPQGSRLLDMRLWGIAGIIVAAFAVLWRLPWLEGGISFAWLRSGYGRYLGWHLLAVLPFVGFVVGGLRDLAFKLRQREEFATLAAGWLLAALLSQSPTLSFVLVLLAAKQMQLYFHPRYPFHAWVRAGAILQLIFAFFVLCLTMIYGFWEFGGPGFRKALLVSGLYWGFGLLGVIGLYSFQHRLLIGGPILAGVGITLLFWLILYPLLETKRQWQAAAVVMAESKQNATADLPLIINVKASERFPAVAVYARDEFSEVILPADQESQKEAWDNHPGIFLLDSLSVSQWAIPAGTDTLSGWNDSGKTIWFRIATSPATGQ